MKPENMSFEEAAAAPMGGLMALNILNKLKLQAGQKVLIHGASGGIGSAALQLAKQKGTKVTGVCGASGLEYIREFGADEVIDYREEDFTLKDAKYDLVIDILGRSSFSRVKRVLTSEGVYLRVSFKFKQLIQMLATSFTNGKKVVCTLASPKPKDLLILRKLIEEGQFRTIVDRSFPMEETAKAHDRAENEKKRGKVVITL